MQTTAVDPFQLKLQEFRVFYPAVATARHKGMKTKQILKLLTEGGLKLYPALLEKLMTAMEQAEGTPSCELCGQPLRSWATELALDNERPSGPASNSVDEIIASHV
ncbi:MAG: hypothetical protein ABS82_03960 [Rhodanobacter sp. SCN 67-45]|nr:MAG: hypothetical protein ABS82_03960 [Rhodanobacter sp. SCN 67-45]